MFQELHDFCLKSLVRTLGARHLIDQRCVVPLRDSQALVERVKSRFSALLDLPDFSQTFISEFLNLGQTVFDCCFPFLELVGRLFGGSLRGNREGWLTGHRRDVQFVISWSEQLRAQLQQQLRLLEQEF